MPKTMLIDATHSEETRVAIVDGNRLVEYDYESKVRKQLKGSIFLAKVTRVEPSLQAAFVNFGGNRHGFLPFSEIHPDYFRIPIADREALIAAQRAELEEHDEEMERDAAAIEHQSETGAQAPAENAEDEDEEEELEAIVEVGGEDQPLLDEENIEEELEDDSDDEVREYASSDENEEENVQDSYRAPVAMEAPSEILHGPRVEEEDEDSDDERDEREDEMSGDDAEGDDQDDTENEAESGEFSQNLSGHGEEQAGEQAEGAAGANQNRGRGDRGRGRGRNNGRSGGRHGGRNGGGRGRRFSADRDDQSVDTLGGDSVDGDRPFRFNLRRNYKIQEVIKRGQIMLIQVSKEERGNKGAAVTTYLSLPGRYCVLMPNSPRGGGVSRKIASFKDRKRMKEMMDDLAVPDGMSIILRTAGVTRTKVEIKRDLDYLTRLWNTIREHTLKSSAPALIYEEGNLIKRAIRDLYSRDIEDVVVSGEEGYRGAKDFMKMLMPSHAKKVQLYNNDRVPMFQKFGVENQITDIGEPVVNLRSGGYLVINPTEALVSIDVNSGRATKERHIEETALKTNLEAADELARQLRLRDLGGLVVVDFIDMEDRRNNRKVEQRLRDALSSDRARIQVGRISSFGLLELSRQRMNPSLAEAQQEVCAHCAGTGRVKTLDFAAISLIRAIEAEGVKSKGNNDIILTLSTAVALYILNNKRSLLSEIERRYAFDVIFATDDTLSNSQFRIETSVRSAPKIVDSIVSVPVFDLAEEDSIEIESEDEDEAESEAPVSTRQPRERGERAERSEQRDEDGEGANRRRRGRRGGRNRTGRDREPREATDADAQGNVIPSETLPEDDIGNRVPEGENDGDDARGNRDGARRRRGRRGGRGRGRDGAERPAREDGNGQLQPDPAAQEQPHYEPPRLQPAAPIAAVQSAPAVSNDVGPQEAPAPRNYETVNKAPDEKKKGWWNKLIE